MILSQSVVSGPLGLFLDTPFKEKYKLTGLWEEEGKGNAILSCELCSKIRDLGTAEDLTIFEHYVNCMTESTTKSKYLPG